MHHLLTSPHPFGRWLFGGMTGALFGLWVGLDVAVRVLVLLMALDIVTGLAAAFAARAIDSRTGWRGISRKCVTLGIVAAAAVLDPHVGVAATQVVAGFYAAIELTSLIENAALAGVPVPAGLRDALVQWQRLTGERSSRDPDPRADP